MFDICNTCVCVRFVLLKFISLLKIMLKEWRWTITGRDNHWFFKRTLLKHFQKKRKETSYTLTT